MKIIKIMYIFIGGGLSLLSLLSPHSLQIYTPLSRWGVLIIGGFMFSVALYSLLNHRNEKF